MLMFAFAFAPDWDQCQVRKHTEEFDPKHGVSSEKITKIPLEDDGARSKRGERTLPMQFHLDHSPLTNPSLFKQYSSTLA